MSNKVAVVTGAAGYVGTWVVRKLLDHGGYTVRGTVRSIANSQEFQRVFPSVQLFEAALLSEGSFDQAFTGASVVFHVASPFQVMGVTDPQAELIDPAVKGTLNVLRSVERSPSAKRVVLTSSTAAMEHQQPPAYVFSEKDWNTSATIETMPYPLSKTLAERAAWHFVEGADKHFDLVAVNPSVILGPILTARPDGVSINTVAAFLKGAFLEHGVPPFKIGVVDVRDVAQLQVLIAETPDAEGRHVISSPEGISFLKQAEVLRASGKYSEYGLPTKEAGPVSMFPKYNASKVTSKYIPHLIPIEQTMVEMADSLIQFGLVPRQE